jgi:hypothetical protein
MICLVCKKAFVIKRGIYDLFSKQRYFICDKCFKEHPIKLEYSKIPLDDNYALNVISILPESSNSYYLAYLNEYSMVVERYLNRSILLFDKFYLTKRNLNIINTIAKLERCNIFVICFKFIIN